MGGQSCDSVEESPMDDRKTTVTAEQGHLLSTSWKTQPVKPHSDEPLPASQIPRPPGIEEHFGLARSLPDQEKLNFYESPPAHCIEKPVHHSSLKTKAKKDTDIEEYKVRISSYTRDRVLI